MTRAALYLRVSTQQQADQGLSMDAQEARLRAYCNMRGLEVVEVIRDPAVSAATPLAKRPGGRRVLELVKAGAVQHVVAYKLDRLFRNTVDCLTVTAGWDRKGVSMHLVDMGGQAVDTSSTMGRFMLTVMAGAAELERNQIGERTSAALQHKRRRGEYTGGHARKGYTVGAGGALVANQAEQAAIALAAELRAAGASYRSVASQLAAAGHVNRNGRPYSASSIRNMVAA